MGGPEFNPRDDEPIDREEYEKAMGERLAQTVERHDPTLDRCAQPSCGHTRKRHWNEEEAATGHCMDCDCVAFIEPTKTQPER